MLNGQMSTTTISEWPQFILCRFVVVEPPEFDFQEKYRVKLLDLEGLYRANNFLYGDSKKETLLSKLKRMWRGSDA